jgi:hypothetical protein
MKQQWHDRGTNDVNDMFAGSTSNVCLLLLAAT